MMQYFKRQIELWGEEKQHLLQQKKIAIIGAGGLGSSLCYALGTLGIKEIHIIDFDTVALHNIHRQIAFTMDDNNKNKADINALRIQKRSPYTKATAHTTDFKEWSKKETPVDLIIDATDNLPTREEIEKYAKRKNIPWIYGSSEAFHGQVAFIKDASFCDAFKITQRKPAGVGAPILMHIASLQANLALRYLLELSIKKDILYYIFFNDEGELITQKFGLPK